VWVYEEDEVPHYLEHFGVTSNIWQSHRSRAYLVELLYVTDTRCCLTLSLSRTYGGPRIFYTRR